MNEVDVLPAIVVHGGAGAIDKKWLPGCREGCRIAAKAGWAVLRRGGSAVDAVGAAVAVLEDDPRFNAGTGSVLNKRGEVETDASIMYGATLACGAVGAVSGVRNPVRLARAVMEHSPHVLLAGEGAQTFARAQGVSLCDPAELIVEESRSRWKHASDTVGCVALDCRGRLAGATSTGGIFRKLPGRVGDSPLIGCGNYADERVAISCTGHGEDIVRTVLAHRAAQFYEHSGDVLAGARQAIDYLAARTRGEAGLIMVNARGAVGYACNAPHMPVCAIGGRGLENHSHLGKIAL